MVKCQSCTFTSTTMNYLAHAYLSFGQEDILVGNMISDFIKGKNKLLYSSTVQQGIMLHRAIDNFTDTHDATKQAKQYFKTSVGLYAGAFVDVAYDHFLANDTNEFINDAALQNFATSTYHLLQKNSNALPIKFANMLPYMQNQNWLYNYKFNWGIQNSFEGVARRAVYLNNADAVFKDFENNYQQLKQCYQAFFPSVKIFAMQHLQQLQNG
jgi:acyl carrier protein phosphodiesterase